MNGIEGSSEDSMKAHGHWAFGDFTFDAATLELRRGGDALSLEPRPARILAVLLGRANQMVSREELRELGWPRLPAVADDSLNTCVRQIRDAMGDSAREPHWLQTLRGRGYRFSGEVQWIEVQGGDDPGRAMSPSGSLSEAGRFGSGSWRGLAVGVVTVGALAILTMAGLGVRSQSDRPEVRAAIAGVVHRMEVSLDPAGALPLADDAVRLFPRVAEVHAVRASVQMVLGDWEAAWAETGRALALDGDDATALRVAGNLHLLEGSWADAETALLGSAAADPAAAQTWVSLAFLRTIRGDFEGGLLELNRALAIDPLSPLILGDAGILHLWANRPEEALAACTRAYEVEPRATWAIPCAFDAARLAGRDQDALDWGARLTGLNHQDASIDEFLEARVALMEEADAVGQADLWSLALAYATGGRVEDASRAFVRAAARPGFGVMGAAVDPRLAPLRDNVAFREALERLGLQSSGTG